MKNKITNINSIEKSIEEYYGFEYDFKDEDEEGDLELESSSNEHPFDVDKIRIDQQMLSLKYLTELMHENQVLLNPGFQRNKVWKERKRKSLLIESLILRIPIPAFYFYENEDSKFIVIDGLQRLSTIDSFIKDDFRLFGLEYLSDQCDGKKFSELEVKYQQRIYRTQLAVNILDARSPSNVVFDIFRRVNTGGISLKPQEIRNAISKNQTRKVLKELYNSEEFKKATHGRIRDDRMDGQELVLRFFAFYKNYDFENQVVKYNSGNIAKYLDDALLIMNKATIEELNTFKENFKRAMLNAYSIFNDYTFRKCYLSNVNSLDCDFDVINKSLYTTWAVILSNPLLNNIKLSTYSSEIINKFAQYLSNDIEYDKCLTQGTNSTKAVHYSFKIANQILMEVFKDDKKL